MTLFLRRVLLAVVAAAVACQALITEEELAEKAAQGLRLIDFEEGVEPVWMTEDEKLELIRSDKNFFDVTETYDPLEGESFTLFRAGQVAYSPPSRRADVTPLIAKISLSNMQGYLANLTNFHNRYYRSATGAAASVWIRDTVQQIATSYPTSRATVSLFAHSFVQSSIIAKIPGKNPAAPIVVLGAHMDSINSRDTSGRAPGADDDGSGSVNLLEAFRVLVTSGFQPEGPVEFHWYAGEEAGLLGSQAIARDYKSRNVELKGMLQLDMTAYVRPGSTEVISLMPDFTNSNLTSFIGALVDNYSRLNWAINNPCGYACSDHASWDRQGYPAALPFEGTYPSNSNGVIHSASDTITVSGFSWDHTLEYTKLAVAYAYELGFQ
ncbi:hypothetical protein EST38_g5066 [Candolleomyces aberdarensis]|uniref:Peptide hydrolase n=1 Tax=Candolleomyces aberdarensis TaxID=2316362 RepID=A0A4Q2DPM3_9AGAR|nr:hypothetical protein EST38_g5066 [Candolleomyces aberdarensis]